MKLSTFINIIAYLNYKYNRVAQASVIISRKIIYKFQFSWPKLTILQWIYLSLTKFYLCQPMIMLMWSMPTIRWAYNWSEWSACAALGRCGRNVVSNINIVFGLSGVRALPLGVAAEQSVHYFGIICLHATYFSPRMGCPRVMKLCTEFYVTKKEDLW